MTACRTFEHSHSPVFRVVRAGWPDPLDASFSRKAKASCWNTSAFPALYCCCSPRVARAVTRDLLRISGLEVSDLQPAYRPRLVEIAWRGDVVDVTSAEGIAALGFPPSYPEATHKKLTRQLADQWHQDGLEGVCCRSASLWRLGFKDWTGDHERWGELAIYVEKCRSKPEMMRFDDDPGWLSPAFGEPGS